MIEFKNVTKILNGQKVLDNVSFKVKANETVLLVGSSGAGKTTILKLILRLIEPTSGTIKVLQKDISKISEDEMNEIRQKCGLVFQDGALFDSLTIAENVG
ncbi:MAG: ATP-binding cassette domain-containing protein, partial [Calditrichia bacterium]